MKSNELSLIILLEIIVIGAIYVEDISLLTKLGYFVLSQFLLLACHGLIILIINEWKKLIKTSRQSLGECKE